jgi:hypothetical protein
MPPSPHVEDPPSARFAYGKRSQKKTQHGDGPETHCFSSANRCGRATAFSPDNDANTEAMVPSALAFGAGSKASLTSVTFLLTVVATE